MKFTKVSLTAITLIVCGMNAYAWEYKNDKSTLKLSAMGTVGAINPDYKDPLFINDWRVRAEYSFAASTNQTVGAVYSLDAKSMDSDEVARDAFIYVQDKTIGRFELGITHSVAKKMSLGLPDVGGLRINDQPLIYKKMNPAGNVISDVSLNTDNYVPRINYASQIKNGVQYGLSVAGLTNNYAFTTDAAVKVRHPAGKTKVAYAFGVSFMDKPNHYQHDRYSAPVTADWRAQMSASMNLQYNSWIWGLTGRVIYDQDPVGPSVDGIVAGTGVSYDVLKYSLSATYLFSDTGIWDDTPDFMYHTGLLSFRYKYSQNVDMWMSAGITRDTPFFAVGLRAQI